MDSLELELQTVVSCLMWVLGTEWTSGRAAKQQIFLSPEPSLRPRMDILDSRLSATGQARGFVSTTLLWPT